MGDIAHDLKSKLTEEETEQLVQGDTNLVSSIMKRMRSNHEMSMLKTENSELLDRV